MEVTLDDIHIIYIESATGVEGAPEAFRRLESLLPSLKGRKLPTTFAAMSEEFKNRVDASRPSIEFYRSQKELLLFLPIQ